MKEITVSKLGNRDRSISMLYEAVGRSQNLEGASLRFPSTGQVSGVRVKEKPYSFIQRSSEGRGRGISPFP